MQRFHLMELEDQPWCPRSIRAVITDYLRFTSETMGLYEPIARRLSAALQRTGSRRVVDLCSGAGGPWRTLLPVLEREAGGAVEVCLTDCYPNLAALERVRAQTGGRVTFEPRPVDARHLPEELTGFRTLFTALHHFRPEQARQIIQDAAARRQGIGIFEFTRRAPMSMLFILVGSLLGLLFSVPFIRPFRWSRLLWTYLVPLGPLAACMDGIVSCLRTYTPEELRGFVSELGVTGYEWEIGLEKARGSPAAITYLIGHPALEAGTRTASPPSSAAA